MRNSSLFFLYITSGVVLLSLLLVHASFSESARQAHLEEKAMLVKTLKLTDLCLFTEARYTPNVQVFGFDFMWKYSKKALNRPNSYPCVSR